MKTEPGVDQETVDERAVVAYLRTHPEFFERNGSLLTNLRVPHQSGAAVSLLEYQVQVLREQRKKLENKLHELVEVARDNDRLNERMHALTLSLMEAGGLEEILLTVQDTLRSDFLADVTALRLFTAPDHGLKADAAAVSDAFANVVFTQRGDPGLSAFDKILHGAKPMCGRLRREQLDYLFGERANEVASAVLIPLGRGGKLGMVAVGSFDRQRYHAGMGTVFLKYLGELISGALRPHMSE